MPGFKRLKAVLSDASSGVSYSSYPTATQASRG